MSDHNKDKKKLTLKRTNLGSVGGGSGGAQSRGDDSRLHDKDESAPLTSSTSKDASTASS